MTVLADEITLYWIRGCGNCTRVKGYLTDRGVGFTSVNVQDDAAAAEELKRAGRFSIPILRRGDKWVSAGDLEHVNELLGLKKDSTSRELSAEELIGRSAKMLKLTSQLAQQLPSVNYDDPTPTLGKSTEAIVYRGDGTPYIAHSTFKGLIFHMVGHGEKVNRIALASDGFHELGFTVEATGDYAAFGEPEASTPMYRVTARLELQSKDLYAWLRAKPPYDLTRIIQGHHGPRSMYKHLQTHTISLLQHARQLEEVVQGLGIEAKERVEAKDLEGLVMPSGIWG